MAIRSMIAIKKDEENYNASYCHWDGHPNHNGKILVENYNTEDKVFQLLEKGDMSSLGKTLDNSVFYYSNCGEDLNKHESLSYTDLKNTAKDVDCEYIYVFFPDENVWRYVSDKDNFSLVRGLVFKSSIYK